MLRIPSKKVIFLIVAVLSVLSIIYIFSLLKTKKNETGPVQTSDTLSYKSFVPGESTKDEIIKTFGQPEKEITKDNLETQYYPSNSPTRKDELILENDKLIFAREIVTLKDNKSAKTITEKYGTAPYVLYGPDAYSGFYLYIYPEKGIAYIGNPNSGHLLEIWYFTPQSIEDIKSKWAKDYNDFMEPRQ